eukprot:9397518-Pyramimonas_sp.AAC.1
MGSTQTAGLPSWALHTGEPLGRGHVQHHHVTPRGARGMLTHGLRICVSFYIPGIHVHGALVNWNPRSGHEFHPRAVLRLVLRCQTRQICGNRVST